MILFRKGYSGQQWNGHLQGRKSPGIICLLSCHGHQQQSATNCMRPGRRYPTSIPLILFLLASIPYGSRQDWELFLGIALKRRTLQHLYGVLVYRSKYKYKTNLPTFSFASLLVFIATVNCFAFLDNPPKLHQFLPTRRGRFLCNIFKPCEHRNIITLLSAENMLERFGC